MYNTEGKTLLQTLQYEKLAQHLSMHKEAKRGQRKKKGSKNGENRKRKTPNFPGKERDSRRKM